MNTDERVADESRKATLSTLWIFVLLNIVFRDIHELFRPGFVQEILSGTEDGSLVAGGALLIAGMVLEIPIAMVILSRVLKRRINRWVNVVAGLLGIALVATAGFADPDDMFFAGVEIIGLVAILWFAWTWPCPVANECRRIGPGSPIPTATAARPVIRSTL